MTMFSYIVLSILVVVGVSGRATNNSTDCCEVRARTEAGWMCGKRMNSNDYPFASFYNVPYAQQPLGKLRFQELQPVEPWDGLYNATVPGPICPYMVDLLGTLMTNKNVSESCIHANVHVPMYALQNRSQLPILVYIHSGAFLAGSGETDVYGPEYLVTKDMMIVTFTHRLHLFGYLLVDSPSVPENRGLRDIITILKWVQTNARNLGGNPNDVTLAGHGSGSASAHLLTLSKASEGLFHRAILMSGTGVRSFFSPTQEYARDVANVYYTSLGINSTDPEEIHQQLISMPLETLMNATAAVGAAYFPISFAPFIETSYANITSVIDQDPEVLLNSGQGNNITLIIGFTNLEEAFFLPLFTANDILGSIEANPLLMVPQVQLYNLSDDDASEVAQQTIERYFNGTPTVEKYGKFFADANVVYPALKLAQLRASLGGAPVYLYHYAYNASFDAMKVTQNISYDGATHGDDYLVIFRTNSMVGVEGFEPATERDTKMRALMTGFVQNFMNCGDPTCNKNASSSWPAEDTVSPLQYKRILEADDICYTDISEYHENIFNYYESIFNYGQS